MEKMDRLKEMMQKRKVSRKEGSLRSLQRHLGKRRPWASF